MREPYGEGLVAHSGPESCGGPREGTAEASTGVHVGRVLSPEKSLTMRTPTQSLDAEGNTTAAAMTWLGVGPSWSETPGMHGNSSNGNREILGAGRERWKRGPRWESARRSQR
jgi:hypothetical protein